MGVSPLKKKDSDAAELCRVQKHSNSPEFSSANTKADEI
jgi:hypothetical protein